MKKILSVIYSSVVILGLLLTIGSCKKETNNSATINIGDISNITTTEVLIQIMITTSGKYEIKEKGVCWSITSNPVIGNNNITENSSSNSFISNIKNLSPGVKYYVRGYLINNKDEIVYSDQISFTTRSIPTGGGGIGTINSSIITENITNITSTSARSGGTLVSNDAITARGVCWSTTQNPTTSANKTSDGSTAGSFISSITGLISNTKYYVRSYAIVSNGTIYGAEVSFTTSSPAGGGNTGGTTVITVSTSNVTAITGTSVSCGGSITGTGTIVSRGVCWSTSQNPTTSLSTKTTNGSGSGTFLSPISNLTPNTTYYARAYANTNTDVVYGNQVSFTTSAVTMSIKTIRVDYTALGSAIIISSVNSNQEVISMGVCYSTSPNPTILNTKSLASRFGNYEFSATVTTEPCVKFYVRAFATVKGGNTYYGNELTFKNTTPLNDCHPFNGIWKRDAGAIVYRGNYAGFVFQALAPNTTSNFNWRGAYDAKLISFSTSYIKDVVKTSETTWKCSVLWFKGSNNNNIVTEVKYGPGTISISSNEKQITVSGTSPYNGVSSSAVMYKE